MTTTDFKQFEMKEWATAITALDGASQKFAKEFDADQNSDACRDALDRVVAIALHLGRKEPLPD